MLVIRRLVDRHRSYTGLFLPGETPKIFPTTDYEHARILQIYKQDRRYEGVENDFSDGGLAAPASGGGNENTPPKRGVVDENRQSTRAQRQPP